MARTGVVFAKDWMVNDCCCHLLERQGIKLNFSRKGAKDKFRVQALGWGSGFNEQAKSLNSELLTDVLIQNVPHRTRIAAEST